ncbi:MAG: glycosyltransferase, partial [Chloroflexi bacterium]|nr:glycosyltransferase [Chloroflexota bacterium]
MHILWLTGVQLPAVTGEDLNRAGWQEGLRRVLYQYYPDLKLSIASFGSEPYQPFHSENATYYNIYREPQIGSRLKRIKNNWTHSSYKPEDLVRIIDLYERINPDLVFIFGTENPFGLVSDRFSVPTIISIQAVINGLVKNLLLGLSPSELSGEFFSRQTIIGQGIFHKWWTHKKFTRIEKIIYQKNQYFAGRTDWDRSWLGRLDPSARYFHIDRVLGSDYYQSVWQIESSNENQIFSLSGNAPFKGGVSLVRAVALLKHEGYDQIRLRLAGVNPESNVGKYITKIIRKADLNNQIILLGRLAPAEIVKEMLAARLFVLPSHMDNSPNSLAEAMILGLPCIASNAGGIPSMLKDNSEGLIYQHTDIKALAAKILLLLDDHKISEELGKNARQTALTRHNPERIA